MPDTTAEEERRQKLLTQITTYFAPLNLAQLEEAWSRVQDMSTQRSRLILYIVEHHLDPGIETTHFPSRKELDNLPIAALQEIVAQIEAAVKIIEANKTL